MKIRQITTTLTALALLVLPAVSSANTYQYVDTGGKLQSTEANSSTEALATAYNIGLHSGVISVSISGVGGSYDSSTISTTNTSGSFYQFVDIYGNVQSMNATTASVALSTAPNIGSHSGVVLVNNNTAVD